MDVDYWERPAVRGLEECSHQVFLVLVTPSLPQISSSATDTTRPGHQRGALI